MKNTQHEVGVDDICGPNHREVDASDWNRIQELLVFFDFFLRDYRGIPMTHETKNSTIYTPRIDECPDVNVDQY